MTKNPPPPTVMLNLAIGYWIARLIYVAAKLKLADPLKDGPRTVDDLATAAGVQAPALYRVLRALASVGVFAETNEPAVQAHAARRHPSDRRPRLHARRYARFIVENYWFDAWNQLLSGVTTGELPFLEAHRRSALRGPRAATQAISRSSARR